MSMPSAMNIKFKFPRFENVADGDIEFAIEEAVVACGTPGIGGEWIDDANQTLAIMYYTAHLLQLALMRPEVTGQIVTSERTPDLSRTYATPPQPSMDKPYDLTTTIYGVRFLGLVRKNFPAVLTVGSAVRM